MMNPAFVPRPASRPRPARRPWPRIFVWPLLVTYLWVSILHALWHSVPSIATALTYLFTGWAWQLRRMSSGYGPQPTDRQEHLYTAGPSDGGLATVALLGG